MEQGDTHNDYEWLLEQYKVALDASNIVSITDNKGVIEYVNDKFCAISGYPRHELIGKQHNIIRHPDMSKTIFKDLWETIKSGKIWKGVIKNKTKDGDDYIVDSTIIPIKDMNGVIQKYIGIRHDITELTKKDELIKKQATDSLTGSQNTIKLMDDLKQYEFPVFTVLNIDSLAEINDFYGLDIGDSVIRFVADWLLRQINTKHHALYKMHGDEFGILSNGKEHADEHLALVNAMLIDIKKVPFDVNGQPIYISLTAGSALENETVIGKANMALRYAKKEQKFHQLFDPVLLEAYKYGENIEWANKVRNAIEQDRIVTYYQPILNIQKNTIDKYEALVRLIDENGAVILPGSFLEIAKKSKQYLAITKKVLRDAIKMASENEVKISINMTIEDIESSDIVSVIETTLDTYGCGPKIVFEITETEEIKNYHALRGFIDFVKSRFGCEVSIDDFGSGYSNFENLLELDFDYLKIDGSIVKKVSDNVQSTILLDAIIAFSQKLHIATVAEYVYDEKVFELVKAKGVNYAQGFFIGKPIETLLPSHEWTR